MDFPAVRENKKARRDGKKSATPASLICKVQHMQTETCPYHGNKVTQSSKTGASRNETLHNRGGCMPESASQAYEKTPANVQLNKPVSRVKLCLP